MMFCVTYGVAQVTGRIEYPYSENYYGYYVSAMENKGLLVEKFANKADDGKRIFKIEFFSTDMKKVMEDSSFVDKKADLYDNFYNDGINYTILSQKDGGFSIHAFDVLTKKTTVTDGEFTRKTAMRDYVISNGLMAFSSTLKKIERIGIIDLKTGKNSFTDVHIDGVKDKNVYILENAVIGNVVYSLVKAGRDIYLARIDTNGKLLGYNNLTKDYTQNIICASISKAGDKYFLTGTYSVKGDSPQGVYFAELDNWQFKFVNFHNFLDLKNFTEYMSDKGKAKIERRKAKAEKKGEEYTLNYNMTSHNILSDGKNYFYLGEAYYPVYHTVMMGTGMNCMTSTVFDGYEYTHAVLVKFNDKGEILWDECFPMHPRKKPFFVKRFISAGFKDNNVNLIFADGKRLVSKLFLNSTGGVLQERKADVQDTDDEAEEVKRVRDSNTEYWYGNNFLVYGNQVVKNNTTGERRKVVYINKYTIK